jgi:hypothetical protein
VTDPSTSADSALSTQLEVFRIIEGRLQEAVRREEDVDYRSARANQRTQLIGRLSLFTVLLLTPPVFYLIWTLVIAMGIITDRMGAMHGEVGGMTEDLAEVSARMVQINGSVARMTEHIAVLPPMEQRLRAMRGDLGAMTGSMSTIAPDVGAIDQTLAGMQHNMGRMDEVMGFLSQDMFRMRHNVNQMSSPMRMIPFFGQ